MKINGKTSVGFSGFLILPLELGIRQQRGRNPLFSIKRTDHTFVFCFDQLMTDLNTELNTDVVMFLIVL